MTHLDNPDDFQFLKTQAVKLIRETKLEINSDFKVERIPFRSNGFYFTHDFWLENNTLIFESWVETKKVANVILGKKAILFKAEFEPNAPHVKVTRILPESLYSNMAVLAWNKEFIVTHFKNEITILSTDDYSVIKNINLDLPPYYRAGQFSLTSDDKWLMYEVNLNWEIPAAPKRTEISTYMVLQNLENGEIIKFNEKPYPWMWSHLLCNPCNPNQITSALVKYTQFGKTEEYEQRLWLSDISIKNSGDIKTRPLYKQRKKNFFRRAECITHECWGKNGKYLTFIVRRNKIKRVEVATNKDRIIMNKGPNPWHCDGSFQDWIVFDTMNKDTGIWLGAMDNSKVINLCLQHTDKNGQMYHPHPFFNKNQSYVFFNADLRDEGHLYRVKTPL
ncbi:MAG: hypothetical protein GF364_15805 [Candidatus Lokiarchaeota archaeon]|nr:hypothetical protein [Candidatus Lokiarchaeota archaeon]